MFDLNKTLNKVNILGNLTKMLQGIQNVEQCLK